MGFVDDKHLLLQIFGLNLLKFPPLARKADLALPSLIYHLCQLEMDLVQGRILAANTVIAQFRTKNWMNLNFTKKVAVLGFVVTNFHWRI